MGLGVFLGKGVCQTLAQVTAQVASDTAWAKALYRQKYF